MSSRIEQIIEEIEEYVDSCKYQPLSTTKIVVNKEEIEELERGRRVQEEMMQSIISAGKVINSAAQSIKGTVSEVAQATNSVAQSMCDVSAGMESTVSSIQEQTVMTEKSRVSLQIQ